MRCLVSCDRRLGKNSISLQSTSMLLLRYVDLSFLSKQRLCAFNLCWFSIFNLNSAQYCVGEDIACFKITHGLCKHILYSQFIKKLPFSTLFFLLWTNSTLDEIGSNQPGSESLPNFTRIFQSQMKSA